MVLNPLSRFNRIALFILSFLLVAFGQPAWNWAIGLIASFLGFALFWRLLLDLSQKSERFFIAAGWYGGIQVIQLSWMASHPYLYIYGVILFCAWAIGAQFGLLAIFIQPKMFKRLFGLVALAAMWSILEWSRLFFLSGLSFNPAGIALTGSLYAIQFASIGGIYLLSFWVMLTNLMVLRAWLFSNHLTSWLITSLVVLVPYFFGFIHFNYHQSKQDSSKTVTAVLVQTAFPIEEHQRFNNIEEFRLFVLDEWKKILSLVQQHQNKIVDLIVLPEYVVPYGTYYPMFYFHEARMLVEKTFGKKSLKYLPPLEEPYAVYLDTYQGAQYLVTNAFFVQAIANIFDADVVIGLEDSEYVNGKKAKTYSSALHFSPDKGLVNQYAKRVLVPMGEYIPFESCRELAARYGVTGSFECGEEAKVFQGKIPFSPSICYEETYGSLMREGRLKGAELLINLTNDGWFPNSRLPQQHFDHARLRTVETGIPLARACNTGVTAVVDSLGQTVDILYKDSMHSQSKSGALYAHIPLYHYKTLYTRFGDSLIIGFCMLMLLLGFADYRKSGK